MRKSGHIHVRTSGFLGEILLEPGVPALPVLGVMSLPVLGVLGPPVLGVAALSEWTGSFLGEMTFFSSLSLFFTCCCSSSRRFIEANLELVFLGVGCFWLSVLLACLLGEGPGLALYRRTRAHQ